MSVVLGRGEDHRLEEGADKAISRYVVNERTFGVTRLKKFPPFVFGVRGVSCLVHQIANVEAHWWALLDMNRLGRLKKPVLIAHTRCAQSFRLDGDTSRTCHIPAADALPCGRCAGTGATFPKRGPAHGTKITRQEAHVKLGCVVKGY